MNHNVCIRNVCFPVLNIYELPVNYIHEYLGLFGNPYWSKSLSHDWLLMSDEDQCASFKQSVLSLEVCKSCVAKVTYLMHTLFSTADKMMALLSKWWHHCV